MNLAANSNVLMIASLEKRALFAFNRVPRLFVQSLRRNQMRPLLRILPRQLALATGLLGQILVAVSKCLF